MSFSDQTSIKIGANSLRLKFYSRCARFVGAEHEHLDICTVTRVLLQSIMKVIWMVVKFFSQATWKVFQWICYAIILLIVLGFLYLVVMRFATSSHPLILFWHGLWMILKYVPILVAAGLGGILAVVLVMTCCFKAWDAFESYRSGRRWKKNALSRRTEPDSIFRIIGQAFYDRAHGICRPIEIV